MKRFSLLLACLALTAPARAHDETLRTAEAVYTHCRKASAPLRTFDLRGMVTAHLLRDSSSDKSFVLTSGKHRFPIACKPLKTPPTGSVIDISGTVGTGRNLELYLTATNIAVTGHAAVPEPIGISPDELDRSDLAFSQVRMKGLVTDVFYDDIDPRWVFFLLRAHGRGFCAAMPDERHRLKDLDRFIDAEVVVTGTISPHGAIRIARNSYVAVVGTNDMHIVSAPPADPFDSPPLEDIRFVLPKEVSNMRRRNVEGFVRAVWDGNRFLLRTDDGRDVTIELARGDPPRCGQHVKAIGFPETDLFNVNLCRARYRLTDGPSMPQETPERITPRQVLVDAAGNLRVRPVYHGKLVRIRGIARTVPSPGDLSSRMSLESEGTLVPVDAGASPDAFKDVAIGCQMEVTGICIMKTESWHQNTPVPRIKSFSVIMRSQADLRILSRPPWWTPERLTMAIAVLIAALLAIFAWNRALNRIVERRTRQLMKERIAHANVSLKVSERTRLAMELHDALSQSLTGVSLQIDAVEQARRKNPALIAQHIKTAQRTLQSCREELKNCLWDLRNRALEERRVSDAIRKTLAPHVGAAEISISCDVPRSRLSDHTLHTILSIIREAVTNAIRHGHASRISITGTLDASTLAFTVCDNGAGFDPSSSPGVREGHFGLQGISERACHLGGRLDISSTPGKGTTVRISFTNSPPPIR